MMELEQKPFHAAIKSGVVIGLILTGITFLLYIVDYSLLASGWVGFGSLVIYCSLVIYFGINYRRQLGGFINFGPAFQFSFFTLLIMLVITTVGNMLLFIGMDPTLAENMADIGVENTLGIMDAFGTGDAMSSDQIDEIRQGLLESYTVTGMLKSAGVMLVFYAVLALILGATIKKKDKSLDY
ncbi:MAG: DUF4199 domain-containing protein [Anditalea sp.]